MPMYNGIHLQYQLEKSKVAAIVSHTTGIPTGKVRSGKEESFLVKI
jgi:hypothetical protein